MDEPQTDADDDDDLALQMSYKDQAALEKFLKRHYRRVKKILIDRYWGVLDEYEIDWTMNAAALKLYDKADTFDKEKGTLAGWYTTIAINTIIDLTRGLPEEELKPDDALGRIGAYRLRTATDGTDEKEDSPVIKAMLYFIEKKLVGLQQKVVLADLAADGEADINWLAEKFGSTPGSIKATRSNARSKLRQCMIEWESKQERYRGKT